MSQPKTIHRHDYQPPAFWVDQIDLCFELLDQVTEVTSELRFRKNNTSNTHTLQLEGIELELVSIALNQQALPTNGYQCTPTQLIIEDLPHQGILTIVTRIEPKKNTSLEGLYVSNGMYCTQCEAEGFRKITYFPDRPDVMSRFTTKIIADQQAYPVLLSNGNLVDRGHLSEGRHWVKWEDPFKKPCYLFALVAGNLVCIEDTFTTCSQREVALKIFVEPQDKDKVDHAMLALKNAMRWDEQVYGREYDLDIYMIVAVSHFNMGAMENKGLNIFNTSCVLAHPSTTTDDGFERVEGVIAHEYFHNWSGNRVTCRDWFQLSLKEGFTVFRDQSFSADMGSAAVNRVEEVNYLRTHQFAEDAGPMAHPVRPDSYIEINNFYTLTIYEKGSEVVRMLKHLVGDAGFRRGSDLYFERHDGQAVTCDEFVAAMVDANPSALTAEEVTIFKRWYSQAGTPEVLVEVAYVADQQVLQIRLQQSLTQNPKVQLKAPLLIPIKIGVLGEQGQTLSFKRAGSDQEVTETVLPLKAFDQTFVLQGIKETPKVSWLRGFSAPIKLELERSASEWAFMMSHDSDPFSRWEAANQLYIEEIFKQVAVCESADDAAANVQFSETLLAAYAQVLEQPFADLAEKAQMLTIPAYVYLASLRQPVAVDALFQVRQALVLELAQRHEAIWRQVYRSCIQQTPYSPSAEQMGRRRLKNTALRFLAALGDQQSKELCLAQFRTADNMTDQRAALSCIVHSEWAEKADVLSEFYQQWQHEPLVVDQWLMVQASNPVGDALSEVKGLLSHPAFDRANPNKVRSLIGVFAGSNLLHFHRLDGAGYRFLADEILALNQLNPAIAARLVTPLTRWGWHIPERQALMKSELERIAAEPGLSADVYEMVTKSLSV